MAIELRSRSLQPGEVVLVSLSLDADAASVEVSAFGRRASAYRVAGRRWDALVGIDLEQPPGNYTVTARADGSRVVAEKPFVVRPRTFPTRTLRVNPDFVNPGPGLQARIQDEARFTQAIFASPTTERLWTGAFGRPVPHEANSSFGTRSVFNGEKRNPHTGTDFLSPAGTPIHAPGAGRVAAARDLFYSGRTVILDHGLGVFSQLAHMSRIDVGEGDRVEAGAVVGLVGATGRVTGAHLHWGLRVAGARVDPLSLLALMTEDAKK